MMEYSNVEALCFSVMDEIRGEIGRGEIGRGAAEEETSINKTLMADWSNKNQS